MADQAILLLTLTQFRSICGSLPLSEETFPFDEKTLVLKVAGKMYAAADVENFEGITLKCKPEVAETRREEYAAVLPGYHMNKRHWITVLADGSVPERLIREWIIDSYQCVIEGLPARQRKALRLPSGPAF